MTRGSPQYVVMTLAAIATSIIPYLNFSLWTQRKSCARDSDASDDKSMFLKNTQNNKTQ